MATFGMAVGDKIPLVIGLIYDDGTTPDLTGATAQLIIRRRWGSINVLEIENVDLAIDTTAKTVTYDWGAGEITQPGNYVAQVKITYATGEPETFPMLPHDYPYVDVVILPSLGPLPPES